MAGSGVSGEANLGGARDFIGQGFNGELGVKGLPPSESNHTNRMEAVYIT